MVGIIDSTAAADRRRQRDNGSDDGEDERDPVSRDGVRPKQRKTAEAILEALSPEMKNVAILTLYTDAKKSARSAGRQRLSRRECEEALARINLATGLNLLTWNAVEHRISRMLAKGKVEREVGSGRKSTWTPTVDAAAKASSRAHAGEISVAEMYHEVNASLGKSSMSLSTFYRHVADKKKFKRRRERLKPLLTPAHQAARIAFAHAMLCMTEEARRRIIFVDEKQFLTFVGGKLILPVEDTTPQKFAPSKTQLVSAMALVALMEPRAGFDGIVGAHIFVELTAAKNSSKNREAGTLEKKTVNVTAETYLEAWEASILPALKALQDKKVIKTTKARPIYICDDNARPHRAKPGGVLVTTLICERALRDFQLHLAPLDPLQPAQSPDCNPLDTFFWRVLYVHYRRLRAEDRVQRAMEAGRRVADDALDVVADEQNVNEVEDEEAHFLHRRDKERVPLRCTPLVDGQKPKCPGCRKEVKDNQMATLCDFRGSWWHNQCAKACLLEFNDVLDGRGTDPANLGGDEPWFCPQCSYHLCRNEKSKQSKCVICEKPSVRVSNVGGDMITCDSVFSGLFHKSCVQYDEEDDDCIEWFCPVCDAYLPDGDGTDELKQIDEVPLCSNTAAGIEAAIRAAMEKVTRQQMVGGFQTRLAFLKAIVDVGGSNVYEKHWRPPKNSKD